MVHVRAPELPQNLVWFNTNEPLSLKSLKGQIVILDFWTYGCINCLHVIPDLHYLAAKYGDRLTIIGIHSAKFDHEQQPDSIQYAISRYGIDHPVVVDRDRYLWDVYTVRAYPTFVVIDPKGYVVGQFSGEGKRQILEELIQQLLDTPGEEWTGDRSYLQLTAPFLDSPLRFPGKVFADEASDSLFIADTGHHRIVMTTLEGALKATIGTGAAGLTDGDYAIAQFASPQGIAFDRSQHYLYVADTGNHVVRQIDLVQQTVKTIAGTGQQSQVIFPHGGQALDVHFNSPWDLVQVGDRLYIAMAGSHQIWMMDLVTNTVQTWIGTGAEFCVDGSPSEAAFAQPSGITTNGEALFVTDSETSSIRAISLEPIPIAHTVCGSGQLFEFGDRDGIGNNVLLQHCLGITHAHGFLWIADTYNHKIKRVNPVTCECRSIAGTGQPGFQNGAFISIQFSELSGLSGANVASQEGVVTSYLFVADTNNHAIRRLNLSTLEVTTLKFPALCSPYVCLPEHRYSASRFDRASFFC